MVVVGLEHRTLAVLIVTVGVVAVGLRGGGGSVLCVGVGFATLGQGVGRVVGLAKCGHGRTGDE